MTGTLKLGETLTMHLPTWSLQPDQVDYGWRRDDGASIAFNTTTYVVTSADAGHTVTAVATAFKTGYASTKTVVESAIPPLSVLASAPIPTIVGAAQFGSTLNALSGIWGPQPVDLRFQWARDGLAIVGATTRTYVPGLQDIGTHLTVAVTGSKTYYATASRVSAPTAAIAPATLTLTRALTVTGDPVVGQSLSFTMPTWSQKLDNLVSGWRRDGVPIPGTRGGYAYTVRVEDVGHVISAFATASKIGYTSDTQSDVAPAVTYIPLVITRPMSVSTPSGIVSAGGFGDVHVGDILTLTLATFNVHDYQDLQSWRASTSSVSSTYTVSSHDVNHDVVVTQRAALGYPYNGQVFTVTLHVVP
ncbi:hypothetical protein [Subtercola endophyticus]|uniref:hypothetical protein n=1 Tax=Subtercola endophyticus TaxID=2895559 RepID=UPI001E4D828E|nr:hypothetical protein [Subtercola endophyticus]UFS57850.1 hypothetical protein LQ955_12465 [Subtercola endophyticus]